MWLATSIVFLSTYYFLLSSSARSGSLTKPQHQQLHSLQRTQATAAAAPNSIAVLVGNQHHIPNFSVQSPQSQHQRRDVLTFEQARCQGQQRYDFIRKVYRGEQQVPGPTFRQSNFDNGWIKYPQPKAL
ncbi:MAG: hypothetical protein LQ352_005734 [Teloschistes flavicans]|nr:MAG: hypothetical protein LQ352_005734 [Teloschistes flavicans]